MKYRITDLKNFSVAAQCPTLSEAARRLSITQPSLTGSIQRLEQDLGALVFYRSRSGIKLTPRGRLFLSKVQMLLTKLEDLDTVPSSEKIFGGQVIRVGCHSTVAAYTLPKALSFLNSQAPDYKVELHHDHSREIQFKVQKGILDIGIVINPVRVPDLVISKLGSDVMGVWKAQGSKHLDTLICDPELVQSQFILKKWKELPKKMITTNSFDLICRLCASGIGYGILPKKAVDLSGQNLKLVTNFPTYKDEIALVFRPEFGRTLAESITLKALRSVF